MKYVTTNLERDKHVIKAVIRRFGPISRTAICELTNIRPGATSSLVRHLLKAAEIVEAGRVANGKGAGRRQVLLELNREYRFIVGLEFDDEHVAASVLDLQPRIRHTVTARTDLANGTAGLVRQLVSTTQQVLEETGLRASSLLGIGIADPGLVDSRRGVTVMSSTIEFWNDVSLKTIFEQQFGVPALVEMKTRAKAVAERTLGAGRMADDMIYLDYGAGIGVAIITQGRVLYGHSSAAGEFGHTHVMDGGPACKCGSFGCLEAVSGARAIEAKVRRVIQDGGWTPPAIVTADDAGRISVWSILRAASAGEKISSNIVAELADQLGLGLANLVNLLNPSTVVIDKRLALAGHSFVEQLGRIVRRQALTYSSEDVDIRFGDLDTEAGALGVAIMLMDNYFEIPQLKPPRFLIEPAKSNAVAVAAAGGAQ